MLLNDPYSQPQDADPVLKAGTVLATLHRHGARGSAVISIDETGGEARVYKQVCETTPHLWPFDRVPAGLASQMLAGLPATVDLVALHSHPRPEHTCIDKESVRYPSRMPCGSGYPLATHGRGGVHKGGRAMPRAARP